MNLYHKLKLYLKLSSLNHRHPSIAFDGKLTDGDKYCITFIICIALIAITLHFKREIDGELVSLAQQVNKSASESVKYKTALDKSELIIVSMLNGSVKIDGRLKTICVINAVGECLE